jgi:hypothetical protein
MGENQIKRRTQKRLDMLEWMMAIDFDSVEVGRPHGNGIFKKYVQVLDKSAVTVKRGD